MKRFAESIPKPSSHGCSHLFTRMEKRGFVRREPDPTDGRCTKALLKRPSPLFTAHERTATRGSGRIGRSAAARVLDPDGVSLAVAASVRHVNTGYDQLLMSGVDRETARRQVRERVEDVLSGWRATTR